MTTAKKKKCLDKNIENEGRAKKKKMEFVKEMKPAKVNEEQIGDTDKGAAGSGAVVVESHFYRDESTNRLFNQGTYFEDLDSLKQFIKKLNGVARTDYFERLVRKEKGKKGGPSTVRSGRQ